LQPNNGCKESMFDLSDSLPVHPMLDIFMLLERNWQRRNNRRNIRVKNPIINTAMLRPAFPEPIHDNV